MTILINIASVPRMETFSGHMWQVEERRGEEKPPFACVLFTVLHDDDDDDDWDLGKPTSGFHLKRPIERQAGNEPREEDDRREGEYVLGGSSSALAFCLE